MISLGTEFHILAPLNIKLFFMLFVRAVAKRVLFHCLGDSNVYSHSCR